MTENGENRFGKQSYLNIVLRRFKFYAFVILAMVPAYFAILDNVLGLAISLGAFVSYYVLNAGKDGLIWQHRWLIGFGGVVVCAHVVGIMVPDGQKEWLIPVYLIGFPLLVYVNAGNFSRFFNEYFPSFPWDE